MPATTRSGDGAKLAFVTVGTTKFDDLIRALDTDACLEALAARGFSRVLMQIGHGEYTPRASAAGLSIEWYRHNPQYKQDVARADLIISHAGAGSIMDALSVGKKLVVVVNTALMDNHQTELADAMAAKRYCVSTGCDGLEEELTTADFDALVPYPTPNEDAFPSLVDEAMGLSKRKAQ
jgi:beta-1,4-N-acetylglucosaminyltransferase